jgi:predicted DNA-binding transcriptional regulator AlpA
MPTTRGKTTVGLNELAARIGCDRHTLMRAVKEGRFPQPFRPGLRKLYWDLSVIERWLLEKR